MNVYRFPMKIHWRSDEHEDVLKMKMKMRWRWRCDEDDEDKMKSDEDDAYTMNIRWTCWRYDENDEDTI